MPAMVYERLPIADATAAQLGCMLLDDRALLTLEVLEGRLHVVCAHVCGCWDTVVSLTAAKSC